MGRTNKEYKFNNLQGLNTLIDKYGLTKGEAYEMDNIICEKYGDKTIFKSRAAITTDGAKVTGMTDDAISLGYVNLNKNFAGIVNEVNTVGLMHFDDGNLYPITTGLSTFGAAALGHLPRWSRSIDTSINCLSLTFNTLNSVMFFTAPQSIYRILHCDAVAGWTEYGAEAGAVAFDTTNYVEGFGSVKTTITNSNATENGVYKNLTFYKDLGVLLDVYLSDVSDIANIRVRLYQDTTETDGNYWDFTYQEGGQDLATGWNKLLVTIDADGTVIGGGITTATSISGRIKVSAITSANATYDLQVDNIVVGNQTQGLYTSVDAANWTKVKSASERLPTFSRIAVWDGRLFGIYKNRLYWSNVNDGLDFWHSIDTEAKNGDTNTSTLINGLNSTANLKVGLRVSDATGDIPSGATITEITSATSVTISEAATGTTANQVITFQGSVSDDSNWLELDDGDGDELKSINPLTEQDLIALKQNSLHRIKINTTATASLTPYIREPIFSGNNQSGIGCVAPNSVQNILVEGVQNEVWGASEYLLFLARDGVYAIGAIGGPIKLTIKLPGIKDDLLNTDNNPQIFASVDPAFNTYLIYSPGEKTGFIYNISAKMWSTLDIGDASNYPTIASNIQIDGDPSFNVTGRNHICAFGANTGGALLYMGTAPGTTDALTDTTSVAFTSTIKFAMYDYSRERFYKYLMNSSSILESWKSAAFANITITAENEDGATASETITPTASPVFYDKVMKLYGTHISQQYTLTGGGVLHRFIHEIKHTNNKKGA